MGDEFIDDLRVGQGVDVVTGDFAQDAAQFAIADAIGAAFFVVLENKRGLPAAFFQMAIHAVVTGVQFRAFKPANAPAGEIGIMHFVPFFIEGQAFFRLFCPEDFVLSMDC